jgi:ferric-chelate reductase
MILTSFPFFRRRLYSLFMICHIIGLAGFLLGLAMHVPYAVPYCIAGAAIYAFELVCRAGKTRVTTAELRVISGAESVVITIGSLKSGWRAGQHVILRVPALVSYMSEQMET